MGPTVIVIENYTQKRREGFVSYFYSNYRKLHKKKKEEKDLWAIFIVIENYIKGKKKLKDLWATFIVM